MCSPFPSKPTEFSAEEKPHRVRAEAERLSRLSEVDWRFQLKERAKHFDVEETVLREMVVALVRDRATQAKREKAEDQRREKQRLADQKREERERQREHDRADQEAQRKRRKKEMEFSKLNKLPHSEQDVRLAKLAQRLGEDSASLRDEFEKFTDGDVSLGDLLTPATPTTWNVVPWDEPVDVALLLRELSDQISKYVVLREPCLTAAALWASMDWVHNEVATLRQFSTWFPWTRAAAKPNCWGC